LLTASPSISIPEIEARQSLVTLFREQQYFAEDLRSILKDHDDPSRIVQRINLDKRDPNYFLDLKDFIRGNDAELRRLLEDHIERVEKVEGGSAGQEGLWSLRALATELTDHSDLATEIDEAVDEKKVRKKENERKEALQAALDAYQGAKDDDEGEGSETKDVKDEESEEEAVEPVQASDASTPKRGSAHAGAVPETRTITWQELMADSWTFKPQ
jgi:DNA mismatch repair ATPase MutS